jgi:hypothetical protein
MVNAISSTQYPALTASPQRLWLAGCQDQGLFHESHHHLSCPRARDISARPPQRLELVWPKGAEWVPSGFTLVANKGKVNPGSGVLHLLDMDLVPKPLDFIHN